MVHKSEYITRQWSQVLSQRYYPNRSHHDACSTAWLHQVDKLTYYSSAIDLYSLVPWTTTKFINQLTKRSVNEWMNEWRNHDRRLNTQMVNSKWRFVFAHQETDHADVGKRTTSWQWILSHPPTPAAIHQRVALDDGPLKDDTILIRVTISPSAGDLTRCMVGAVACSWCSHCSIGHAATAAS